MKVVLDANVIISALLNDKSLASEVLLKTTSSYTLLLSNPIFAELIEVLTRQKFDRYVNLDIRLEFLRELELVSHKIQINRTVKACRDPNDGMYLELALSGGATCIVSGDSDLLALHPFEETLIMTPREFLEKFAK